MLFRSTPEGTPPVSTRLWPRWMAFLSSLLKFMQLLLPTQQSLRGLSVFSLKFALTLGSLSAYLGSVHWKLWISARDSESVALMGWIQRFNRKAASHLWGHGILHWSEEKRTVTTYCG